ncbi:MAG: site-specific integrase [Methylophilus methylotrophus]|uniref:Site-specific integrase n=1 Tax=Methylophilus methylotrophus TaxID=17 RepID=A0A5C7WMA5_METME|nr:MAG: site-specific integrase [Methylophilus methylotrophus]
MASIRELNGKLFFDFRYKGQRCREYTAVESSKTNRSKMENILIKIEEDIKAERFEYRRYFPNSKNAEKFDSPSELKSRVALEMQEAFVRNAFRGNTPLFSDFVEQWFNEFSVGWRRTYLSTVRQIIDSRLIPQFGDKAVSDIHREDILSFRSTLAKEPGRKQDSKLSSRRINAIVLVLTQVLNEAADRYHFNTPGDRIKPLKLKKTHVQPFTLDEVNTMIATCRPDFKDYFTVRFFTGLRTGEADGLKWKYVDFEKRLIYIRETFTAGEEDYTKNDSSQRDIHMSQPVFEALKRQYEATSKLSKFVFCNRDGKPIDLHNFCARVWYPLLRHLSLEMRTPYQMRHTTATLWLAAGEAPEWIARQLGHTNTEMLFKVYSRYVPNLTRQDGSAFERLLLQQATS